MDSLLYQIQNQSKIVDMYKDEKKEIKKQKAIDKKAKNYYGDSKEYRNEWKRNNKRKAEPRQRTKWIE